MISPKASSTEGTISSYEKAVKLFKSAAEQGNSVAQSKLGFCYNKGHGVVQNYPQAFVWYKKAAEQGHAKAPHKLGHCYEKGTGISKNKEEALQ